jgi:hypothetical protein
MRWGPASVALALVASLFGAAAAPAQQATTTRVSLASTGGEGNQSSFQGSVTADGRFVTFWSVASNLVPGDTNGDPDVFLRDRVTGQTRRLSVGPGGAQVEGSSSEPRITADGRLVVFVSSAPLVPGEVGQQVYLADPATGAVRKAVTLPTTHFFPRDPSISDDGARVVFEAFRSDFSAFDVFAVDVGTGALRRLSQTAGGTAGNGSSAEAAISGDGRWVAFTTDATNLVTPDTNGFRDIVVADLQSGAMQRASVGSGSPGAEANLHSSEAALSRDGCLIAFRSDASNLVAPDPGPSATEVFARDRCSAETEVVSVNNAGTAGTATQPDVSDDGCLVVYRSKNVSPAPSSNDAAVLRDRCAGITSRLDLATSGEPGVGNVTWVDISPGTGRYVAFASPAPNLVAGDTLGHSDVFLRDRAVNARPIAELALGQDGRRVVADARASRDPDGPALTATIAWGDASPDATGLQAEHVYARGGTYAITVTVTDADGATATRTAAVTVPDAASPGGSGGTTGTGASTGAAGADGSATTPGTGTGSSPPALVLDRVALSRRAFGVVPARGRATGRRGAVLSLRLSAAATVTLTFERVVRGRRVRGRCSPSARRGTRCTRRTTAGRLTRMLDAGTSELALTGRLGRRGLSPGAYRLHVDARTADGRQATRRTLTFTIVRVR